MIPFDLGSSETHVGILLKQRSASELPIPAGAGHMSSIPPYALQRVRAPGPRASTLPSIREYPSRSTPAPCTRTGISATRVRCRAPIAGAKRRHRNRSSRRSRPPASRLRQKPTLHLPQQKRPGLFFRGCSAARARQRIKPSSAAASAPVTMRSRTPSSRSAREASSPRMWRADADAMRSPVNRTIPFERSEGKPANVCP